MLVFVGKVDGDAALRESRGHTPGVVVHHTDEGEHGRGSDDDARIAIARPTQRRRCHVAGDSEGNDVAIAIVRSPRGRRRRVTGKNANARGVQEEGERGTRGICDDDCDDDAKRTIAIAASCRCRHHSKATRGQGGGIGWRWRQQRDSRATASDRRVAVMLWMTWP